ncbi:hypothetical protein Tco_1401384 [Tanacetum coccineum]
MLAPPAIVGEGSKQPTEPQPTYSTAPQEILHQVATTTASQPLKDPHTFRRTKRGRNIKVHQSGGSPKKVGEKAINEEMFNSVERAITMQHMTWSLAPRNHGGAPTQTRSERVLGHPIEPPLLEGSNTPRSDESRMELIKELMETCTSLTKRVLALKEAKTAQDRVINRLKLRLKRLEKKRKVRTPQPMKRRLFKGRVETSTNTSLGEDASKHGRSSDKTKLMFTDSDFDVLDTKQITTTKPLHVSTADQVGIARPEVSAATPPTTTTVFDDEDVTMAMAQTLIKMKEVKAKEKGIDPKDKGKSVLVEEEPKKVKIRDQGQRQEEATNAALTEEFDDIQARIDADALFVAKLQQEEREDFTIEERS